MEPVSGTEAPFSVTFTAFFVVHVITDDWPRLIDDALALTLAAGATLLAGSAKGVFLSIAGLAPAAVIASFSESRFQRAGEFACNS